MPENSTGQFRGSTYYLLSVLLWADGDSIAYESHLFMQLVYSWIYENEFMSEIAPTRRTVTFSFTEKLLFQCDSALLRWVTEVCLVSFTILSWANMQVMLNEQWAVIGCKNLVLHKHIFPLALIWYETNLAENSEVAYCNQVFWHLFTCFWI